MSSFIVAWAMMNRLIRFQTLINVLHSAIPSGNLVPSRVTKTRAENVDHGDIEPWH